MPIARALEHLYLVGMVYGVVPKSVVIGYLALGVAVSVPSQARAHPHIFIETGVEIVHGADGHVEAVRISWTYDELFSLLLLEDLGLDADYDGVLTDEEHVALQGFDMDWPDDWEGDVYVEVGGVPIGLGPPEGGPSDLLDNGMLTSVHTRKLARRVDASEDAIVVKVYDPTFYTSYSILPEHVSTSAPGCVTAVFTPDLDAAYAELAEALAEVSADIADPFDAIDFPRVGDRFAEEVRLTCSVVGKEG